MKLANWLNTRQNFNMPVGQVGLGIACWRSGKLKQYDLFYFHSVRQGLNFRVLKIKLF